VTQSNGALSVVYLQLYKT